MLNETFIKKMKVNKYIDVCLYGFMLQADSQIMEFVSQSYNITAEIILISFK